MGRRWQGGTLVVTLVVIAVFCGAWAYADPPFPSITGVTITPDPAHADDTLTANPEGWFDAQGDPEGYLYQWAEWNVDHFDDIPGATSSTYGPPSAEVDDIFQVTVWPYDGKFTGDPQSDTITIANDPPHSHIDAPLNGSEIASSSPILVEGEAFDDSAVVKVVLRLNGGLWLSVNGTTSWSRTLNVPLGENTIEVRAKDDDGVWGPIQSVTFTRLLQAPSCHILSPEDGFATTDHIVRITGDANDNTAVDVVRVRLNGAPWVNADIFFDGEDWHWSRDIGVLQLGDNLIEARARDDQGNWGPIDEITVVHLEQAPTVVITSPANGFVTSADNVTVTGTATDDETVSVVRVRVNGVVWVNATGTTIWSRNVLLPLGTNTIEVRARDNDGIWGPIKSITVTRTP